MMRFCALLLLIEIFYCNHSPIALAQTAAAQLTQSANELGIPFSRYTTQDVLGRTITFYLSTSRSSNQTNTKTASASTDPAASDKLPIILFIDGSGCQSLFQKIGDRVGGGMQMLLLKAARGKAHVLVVEKPGVQFLDNPAQPGSAIGASKEFLEQHTLPRWAEANRAALAAASQLPQVDSKQTLVVGHSEGGLVAARLARLVPSITHVGSLAGGGPVQLFGLAEFRAQPQPNDQPGDSARRRESLYDEWSEILKDPESSTKMWLGHPYRRWSTFLSTSVTSELKASKARLFLAQGGRDQAVHPTEHDLLVAELRAAGRQLTELRIDDADHGFSKPDDQPGSIDGLNSVFGKLIEWYLGKS